MAPLSKLNLTFLTVLWITFIILATTLRHPVSTEGQSVEVYINHFNSKRHNNVLEIERAYCNINYVKSITVLCAGPTCFNSSEFKCRKTKARRVGRNLFDRFQKCTNPHTLHLSNDDDLVLNRWALDTMVAYAKVNTASIVGPYGRRADPFASEEYGNPWHSLHENVALTNAALIPCRLIPVWQRWKEAKEFISTARGGCEDILLNMLSNKLLQSAVVEPKWELLRSFDTKLADNSGGLHGTAKGNWDGYRNECVRWGAKMIPRFMESLRD